MNLIGIEQLETNSRLDPSVSNTKIEKIIEELPEK
jgi:hypothetical protein